MLGVPHLLCLPRDKFLKYPDRLENPHFQRIRGGLEPSHSSIIPLNPVCWYHYFPRLSHRTHWGRGASISTLTAFWTPQWEELVQQDSERLEEPWFVCPGLSGTFFGCWQWFNESYISQAIFKKGNTSLHEMWFSSEDRLCQNTIDSSLAVSLQFFLQEPALRTGAVWKPILLKISKANCPCAYILANPTLSWGLCHGEPRLTWGPRE